MLKWLSKAFGTAQGRQLDRYRKIVKQINAIEGQYRTLSEEEVCRKVPELRARWKGGEGLDALLPEAYALVKNACRRLCGREICVSGYRQKWDMIPYDVQLLGAIALHRGAIAEMQTGEGKTLTAAMPLFLNALTERPVHLVTVNDYLAERDCEWVGEIFRWLGLSVRALTSRTPPERRKEVYEADIVYGTASEFGFDYLRDNSVVHRPEEQCQRGHFFAIVDEIDSILIDEARTPLIISGPAANSRQMYDLLKDPVARIVRLQRSHCNELAIEARRILEQLGCLQEIPKKLSKAEEGKVSEACRTLWMVEKGTPKSKILKKVREHPDMRAEIEKWETYFHAASNREERHEMLSQLYIIVDEKGNECELTDRGMGAWTGGKEGAESDFLMLDLGHEYATIDREASLSDREKMEKKVALREEDSLRKERAHNLRQLLRAHLLMERDVDYIVQNGKIVIIDEHTGRPQQGRRFSDGLHQSIEAKEGVSIQRESQTYATITLQNYFRMYEKLAGMTGTAMTEAGEFKEIYKIDVLAIPTHKKCRRRDSDDEIYMSAREKYHAILEDIVEIHGQGRPILIGTESVEISEKLSHILRQHKLQHTVLNAKHHAKEAEIIAHAGNRGAITLATNMAGRGTDIKLQPGIAELGGLHIIGTTRHQSRRIDRQLRGRCGRQGDPGSSKFYISFEDSLIRLFASPKLTAFLQRFRPAEGESISANILNRSIETAQKRVEQRNYSMRKHTLEYDDVINLQRKEVYAFRNEILHSRDSVALIQEILCEVCAQVSPHFFPPHSPKLDWDPRGYCAWLMEHFPITFEEGVFEEEQLTVEAIESRASERIVAAFRQKIEGEAEVIFATRKKEGKSVDPMDTLREIMRSLLLHTVDRFWQDHLLSIDHLRTDVYLRVIGQRDPLLEFKHEAFALFERFNREVKLEIGHGAFQFSIIPRPIEKRGKKRSRSPLMRL